MLCLYLRLAAPRRIGKAGCPLVEYASWMAVEKKVKMVTCPLAVVVLASFEWSIHHVVNAFFGPWGILWRHGIGPKEGARVCFSSECLFFHNSKLGPETPLDDANRFIICADKPDHWYTRLYTYFYQRNRAVLAMPG